MCNKSCSDNVDTAKLLIDTSSFHFAVKSHRFYEQSHPATLNLISRAWFTTVWSDVSILGAGLSFSEACYLD